MKGWITFTPLYGIRIFYQPNRFLHSSPDRSFVLFYLGYKAEGSKRSGFERLAEREEDSEDC